MQKYVKSLENSLLLSKAWGHEEQEAAKTLSLRGLKWKKLQSLLIRHQRHPFHACFPPYPSSPLILKKDAASWLDKERVPTHWKRKKIEKQAF